MRAACATAGIARQAWSGAALAVLALLGSGEARAWRPEGPAIGVNLYALTSDASEIPFVDVFKTSSPWQARAVRQGDAPGDLRLTRDGWVAALAPGQFAQTMMLNRGDGHYPAGTYTVLYDGKGRLRFGTRGVRVTSDRPGRIELAVTPVAQPGDGINLQEIETDPADPLRNIRVLLPGTEASYRTRIFNPVFLARLAPFHTIRFMGWQRVNRSDAVDWSDRRTPDYATQSSPPGIEQQKQTGVALEYQIELANTLKADPWLTVPIKASDDYIRKMARLVHDTLRPELHPYVEFSNEVWNAYFSDGKYAQEQGLAAGLSADRREAGWRWYALRAAHMFDLWNDVYGADAGRLVHVVGAQQAVGEVAAGELGFADLAKKADVVAISLYIMPREIRPPNAAAVLQMSKDQVLDILAKTVDTDIKAQIERNLKAILPYGLPLIVYEGGQGLTPAGFPREDLDTVTTLFAEVNRDPRIATVYDQLLDRWFGAGGGLFLHFNAVFGPGRYGDWGLLEYQDQLPDQAPKYKEFTSYLATRRH